MVSVLCESEKDFVTQNFSLFPDLFNAALSVSTGRMIENEVLRSSYVLL
jgi:hypothetical protein